MADQSASASVLLHLPGRPHDDAIDALAAAIGAIPGVGRIARGLKLRHAMLVHYDPASVAAQSFVAAARARGLAAQLVGM